MAGLQLALAFSEDPFFKHKKILLVEKSKKNINDKTWCFWEEKSGKWDSIVYKYWDLGKFISSENKKTFLQLSPYTYKMIRSIDFYAYAKKKLKSCTNIQFITDEVTSIEKNKFLTIYGKKQNYKALHVFDSRIPKEFITPTQPQKHIQVHQHFKGWLIETSGKHFTPKCFTMMDFRLCYQETTSFTYLLPISETKALVEFTFFSPLLVPDSAYDKMLEKYIRNFLNISHYKILETEIGNIPMTDFPFEKYHSKHITKIGTAGGWVKASTGYAFKNTEKKITQIIRALKEGKNPTKKLSRNRYAYYDKLFLKVLNNKNNMGKQIFKSFYEKNNIQHIFRYLDEDTSLIQDLKIMGSLYSPAFIRAMLT